MIRPFYTWELMGAPTPPTLIESLVSRYGITGVSADSGVGKTFFAMAAMRSVVLGQPFLGRFPTKRGGVLFVGQDCSLLEYARQMRKSTRLDYARLQRQEDDDDGNPFDEYVRWWIHPGIALERPDHIEALIEAARAVPVPDGHAEPEPYFDYETRTWQFKDHAPAAALIVLDVLSMMHGVKENANDEMLLVFRNIRRLSDETGAAIMVLHHHSYATELHGGRWRGASSQLQTLDGHLELSRRKGGTLWCTTKKFRGIAYPPFAYTMVTTDEDATLEYLGTSAEQGLPADEAPQGAPRYEPKTDPLDASIRTFASGHDGPFTNGEVREFLSVSGALGGKMIGGKSLANRVSTVLAAMIAEGLLTSPSHHKYARKETA